MSMQMSLPFLENPPTPHNAEIWEQLDNTQRAAALDKLAQLDRQGHRNPEPNKKGQAMSDRGKISAAHLAVPPWYISANPPQPKSSATGNQPRANTPWWTAPSNSAGYAGEPPSSTRISAFPVPVRRTVPALPS